MTFNFMGIIQRTRRRENRKSTQGVTMGEGNWRAPGERAAGGQVYLTFALGSQHPSEHCYCWTNKARDVEEYTVSSSMK